MVPFQISGDTLTVYLNNKVFYLDRGDQRFAEVYEHLKGPHDEEWLSNTLDKKKAVQAATYGLVEIVGDEVFYQGVSIHNALTQKLLSLVDQGFDVTPWANFMDNLMKNPSFKSREQLYQFLEKWQAPITPDGHFIAFKNVRDNFYDIHSNSFDNSPGKVVSVPRSQVDDDGRNHCSKGLHACATSYLKSFYVTGGKTVAVKINPEDVVSVPNDYDFAKMRVCRYLVLAEVGGEEISKISSSVVYTLDDYEAESEEEDDYYDSYYSSY